LKRLIELIGEMIGRSVSVRGTPYKVGDEIGHGLHSTVYSGQDLSNGRQVAIKIINFTQEATPFENATQSRQKSFFKEIQTLLYLQPLNPYVIRVFNHEHNDRYGIIIMERGKTFRDTLSEYGFSGVPMPPSVVKRFWKQMVESIYYLHKLAIVHGDCKPENFIQIGSGGATLRLIDMGISFQLPPNVTRRLLTAAGTPGKFYSLNLQRKTIFFFFLIDYVSPEMVNSRVGSSPRSKYGYKADIWALGVILYEMAFGYRPLQALGGNQTKIRFLGQLQQDIRIPDHPDKHLRNILKRCLRCKHRQRPSIEELLKHPYLSRAR
jgi:serine/threonine protein kinase